MSPHAPVRHWNWPCKAKRLAEAEDAAAVGQDAGGRAAGGVELRAGLQAALPVVQVHKFLHCRMERRSWLAAVANLARPRLPRRRGMQPAAEAHAAVGAAVAVAVGEWADAAAAAHQCLHRKHPKSQ